MSKFVVVLIILLMVSMTIAGFIVENNNSTPVSNNQITGVVHSLDVPSKSSNCSFDYLPLPDPSCTTGAVFENLTKDDICWSGYSASVRDVPESLKNKVYESYGVERIPDFAEVDHCVNLAIGGSNDISNLWIQPYNITYGARVKDRVENCLHRLVCNGDMNLQQAQYDVCHNWTKYLKENGGIC
jgi:hypothetical protein